MKRFHFPLRSVATVRSLAELRAQERFSAALHECARLAAQLQAIRARISEFDESLRSGRRKSFRAADEAAFLAAYKVETIAASQAESEVLAARQVVETARQGWLAARRDVRVIEKLEAKAVQAHRDETERENQAALDDRTNAFRGRQTTFVS